MPTRYSAQSLILALAFGVLALPCARAQQALTPPAPAEAVPENSQLSAELFYELLIGEITLRSSQPGTAFTLFLDAARKTQDPALYKRAVEAAVQARAGDSALAAARAWAEAQPDSAEANRHVLQLLLALNRVDAAGAPLKRELSMASPAELPRIIQSLPRIFARVSDKAAAVKLLEETLAPYTRSPTAGAAAWVALGRLRLENKDMGGAVAAARKAFEADPYIGGTVFIALQAFDAKNSGAEALVRDYLTKNPDAFEAQLGYARALLGAHRYKDAVVELERLVQVRPGFAEAWLVLGSLQAEEKQEAKARVSLERYVELTGAQKGEEAESSQRGLPQAYLTLARLADARGDRLEAERWLARVDSPDALLQVQTRRAQTLLKAGDVERARALIRGVPAQGDEALRARWVAEYQLLRDAKHNAEALAVVQEARTRFPADSDLTYDEAMIAERLGRHADAERLLREVIKLKPEDPQAYNALGYSMADRGVRLPEARQLILKAVEAAPDDPFIQDSLGWVEYRMGNLPAALRILEAAYKRRADAEIAAHLGEVLWKRGEQERARVIWREGLQTQPDNDTLRETLQRFKVKP
ncbi:MAG TPA: tetratricopeptide repeat protein [Burkholderiaceae bacterium]|nr:tetratricopeptide repeat protein [Burkholderiaceae bacterium]